MCIAGLPSDDAVSTQIGQRNNLISLCWRPETSAELLQAAMVSTPTDRADMHDSI
jgi:hypothetical protein